MSAATCAACKAALKPEDHFCPRCGQSAARIYWYSSPDTLPREGASVIPDGGSFYLVAQNNGSDAARVFLDGSRLRGLRLAGAAESWVEPHQCVAFPVQHAPGEVVGGVVAMQSEDGPRPRISARAPDAPWWEMRGLRQQQYRAQTIVRIVNERWVIGAPSLLFPPGVRRQPVRIWNDAERARTFDTDIPAGIRLFCGAIDIDRRAPDASAGSVMDVLAEAVSERLIREPDRHWKAGPDDEVVQIRRMPAPVTDLGPDAILSIDFGTRNTGIRLRWRREIVPGRPADFVEPITDSTGATRFPTEMAIHRTGRSFQWGSEVPRTDLPADMHRISGLKTALRTGEEPYVAINPAWTTAYLLERYFEQLFSRIDAFLAGLNPPLRRTALNIRYVITRPVLDGAAEGTLAHRYEEALLNALERCEVAPQSVRFLLEPIAAACGICRLRSQELLALGEGATIAVVDSGGGTTDAAVARLSLKEGHVSLEIEAAASLHLKADNPALPALAHFGTAASQELGGDTLDAALAYLLLTNAQSVLETSGRPVPSAIDVCPGISDPAERNRWERAFVSACRLLKEAFAFVSSQHLCAPQEGRPRPFERPVFPYRAEYEGIYLEQNLFGEQVVVPVLNAPALDLAERLHSLCGQSSTGIDPSRVKQVFYVGGTCIEYFVRQQIHLAFPNAARLRAEAPEEARAAVLERLNAVPEGAVWCDDALFAAAPVDLELEIADRVYPLIKRSQPLVPDAASTIRPFAVQLEAYEELSAYLCATLPDGERMRVARAFYRNATDNPVQGTLQLRISAEQGAVASLLIAGNSIPQWRFVLVEGTV